MALLSRFISPCLLGRTKSSDRLPQYSMKQHDAPSFVHATCHWLTSIACIFSPSVWA